MFTKTTAGERRAAFRGALGGGGTLRFIGALNPLSGMLASKHGFEGVYVSGGALSAGLGLPDVGLTTLNEVSGFTRAVSGATDLPVFVDADTGFGEPMNAGRTVRALEDAGAVGCHLEDQVNPKRCGHLDNKTLTSTERMERVLTAATRSRRDRNFVVAARTDARDVEGFEGALERARRYISAGADMVFPEGLRDEGEFRAFKDGLGGGLVLANMTEFGKTELLDMEALERAGADMVIYPVTSLRLAMGALDRAYGRIIAEGSQRGVVGEMQTRAELYELLGYERYEAFDEEVYNFGEVEGR